MAADGHAAVVDRAGGEHDLGLSKQLFDPPQVAVAQHDLQRGEVGIGAQDIEPAEARVVGDLVFVDREMLGRKGLQITAEAVLPMSAWASLARSPSRMAARCSASRRASARFRQTV